MTNRTSELNIFNSAFVSAYKVSKAFDALFCRFTLSPIYDTILRNFS